MATSGIPVEVTKKTSAKTGNDYLSINLGSIGTLVVYLNTSTAVMYPREAKHSDTVVPMKKADTRPFFNDALPPEFVA